MSDGPREHQEQTHRPRAEEDVIPTATVLSVGIGALLLFFLASLVTVSYLRMREGDRPPLPIPPEIGSSKIGVVEQQIFDLATRGQRDRAAQLERLGSYGWVDRRAGVVHIPIERAMQLVAEGVRAAPSTSDERKPGGQP